MSDLDLITEVQIAASTEGVQPIITATERLGIYGYTAWSRYDDQTRKVSITHLKNEIVRRVRLYAVSGWSRPEADA